MIEVIGLQLYQWDIGRKVRIKPAEGMKVQKVNFTNQSMESAAVADTVEAGEYVLADIPNELLKQPKNVICYAVMVNSDGERTIEEAMFTVKQRNRPDDYDINANAEIKKLVEEVLGENGGETIFEKLEYLKSCLEILFQSPAIKLMREVYGQNKTLKELCNCISEQESAAINSQFIKGLSYSTDSMNTGFSYGGFKYIRPNGSEIVLNSSDAYIANKVIAYPGEAYNIFPVISRLTPTSTGAGIGGIRIIDFRNIMFCSDDTEEIVARNYQLRFQAIGSTIDSIYLPKCSQLYQYSIHYTGTAYTFTQGVHLGKVINGCSPNWLWGYATFDASKQRPTYVCCDDDFYSVGTLYLEKLNIPSECILEIMKKAHPYIEGTTQPILSVGSHNFNRVFGNVDDAAMEEFSNIIEDQSNGLITTDQAYERIKEISETLAIFFEFTQMKGWILQG